MLCTILTSSLDDLNIIVLITMSDTINVYIGFVSEHLLKGVHDRFLHDTATIERSNNSGFRRDKDSRPRDG